MQEKYLNGSGLVHYNDLLKEGKIIVGKSGEITTTINDIEYKVTFDTLGNVILEKDGIIDIIATDRLVNALLTPIEEQVTTINQELEDKVNKVEGKGLSTNDFTNEDKEKLDSLENYDDTEINESIETIESNISNINAKLNTIEENAQVNKLEEIKVNNETITIINKSVNIEVPTTTSDLTNNSGFITKDVNDLTNYDTKAIIDNKLFNKQDKLHVIQIDGGSFSGTEDALDYILENYGSEEYGEEKNFTGDVYIADIDSCQSLIITNGYHPAIAFILQCNEEYNLDIKKYRFIDNNWEILDTIEGWRVIDYRLREYLQEKIDKADIVNNLTTNNPNKVLSAAQGVVIKNAIDNITKGESFSDIQELVQALNNYPRDTFVIGNNIYDMRHGTPDYWVNAVEQNSVQYTYTDDESFINAASNPPGVQVGYFRLSISEADKIDLSQYQKKDDEALNTTNKTVVGGINELKENVDQNNDDIEGINSDVEEIENQIGTINQTLLNKQNKLGIIRIDGDFTFPEEVLDYVDINLWGNIFQARVDGTETLFFTNSSFRNSIALVIGIGDIGNGHENIVVDTYIKDYSTHEWKLEYSATRSSREITSSSTDENSPTTKAVYDFVKNNITPVRIDEEVLFRESLFEDDATREQLNEVFGENLVNEVIKGTQFISYFIDEIGEDNCLIVKTNEFENSGYINRIYSCIFPQGTFPLQFEYTKSTNLYRMAYEYVDEYSIIDKQSIRGKNQPNGYAGLDNLGKIPNELLPIIQSLPITNLINVEGYEDTLIESVLEKLEQEQRGNGLYITRGNSGFLEYTLINYSSTLNEAIIMGVDKDDSISSVIFKKINGNWEEVKSLNSCTTIEEVNEAIDNKVGNITAILATLTTPTGD